MLELAPVEKLVSEIQKAAIESTGVNDLLSKAGQRIKLALNLDQVVIQETLGKDVKLSAAEEMSLNTGKPYVDNQLSEYSAFPELIEFHRAGYKSCILVPIEAENRRFGILIMLSKEEGDFGDEMVNRMSILSRVLSIEAFMKLEKERSVSVARYFDASFNSAMPQMLIDHSGNIAKANKWMLNMADVSTKDISGKKLKDFFNVEEGELANLLKGKPIRAESASQKRVYLLSATRISDRLSHVMAKDITENEELQNKIGLIDIGNDVFMLLDNTSRILWTSGNVEKVLRLSEDTVLGRKLADLIAEPEQILQKMTNAENQQFSSQLKLSAGNDIFIDAKLLSYKNSRGFSCIISRDYEKAIASVRKLVDQITGISNDMVIKMDLLGNVSEINSAAEKLLGYKSGEFTSIPISALCIDRESQARLGEALLLAKRNRIVTPMLLNLVNKKESDPLPVEASVLSLTDQSGKLSGFIINGKELATKRLIEFYKQSAEEFKKQGERLKSESDLKTQFIYNISHDLKTPLTSIIGYSKIIIGGEFGNLTEEQKSILETISGESDRLLFLVLQILEVAKLASGKIKLDMQQVNFNDISENPSIKALAERAKNAGLEFKINIDYDTPTVFGDPNRLIQVFVNLIDNALKFTEEGGIYVNIFRKGKNVRVEITDTGIGIKEEDRIKLFRKFYQVSRKDLTMQPRAGTGLGLSIVKEVVGLHHGKIGVKSVMGKGSTFYFTIPIEKPADKKKRKQEQKPA